MTIVGRRRVTAIKGVMKPGIVTIGVAMTTGAVMIADATMQTGAASIVGLPTSADAGIRFAADGYR